ncbi:hypothetical protein GJ496_003216 [Pomphorhynchus laevis]|nr:hypothetical protein GJ496_003216 [Pomphorhynchus laevis]
MPVSSSHSNHPTSILERIRNKVHTFVNGNSSIARSLEVLEDRYHISREYTFYAVFCILLVYLAVGWGNDFLCDIIAIGYPCMCSISAIESKSLKDDTEWLMYWSVYGCLRVIDYLRALILFWLPFYFLFKCTLLVWMMIPGSSGGSYILYHRFIRPYFLKHSSQIDPILDSAKSTFNDIAKANTLFNDKHK